jgi:HPt (histidine-containing phosphotransfer) domain-containing protein
LAEVLVQVVVRKRPGVVIALGEHADEPGKVLLDQAILHDDYLLLGPERTNRMVGAFVDSSGAKVVRLVEAIVTADWKSAGYLAHNLKGSAGSLGLDLLASKCRQIEETAKLEDAAGAAASVEPLPALHNESVAALCDFWQILCDKSSQRSETSAANM